MSMPHPIISASRRIGTTIACTARRHFASNASSSAAAAGSGAGSAGAKQKIPPHVAAELRRHVAATKTQASPKGGKTGGGKGGSEGGWSKGTTLAACCAFTAAAGSIPYLVMKHFKPLNEREEALTHAQIRRGAFMNSGSRDVGKDPMWDFKSGTRIKDKDYVELFEKDEGPGHIDHDDKNVGRGLAAARKR